MEEKLIRLKEELEEKLKNTSKEADVLNVKSEYVGKKSEIANILANLKDMSIEDKKKYGSLINNTKKEMEELVNKRLEEIENNTNITFDDTTDYEIRVFTSHNYYRKRNNGYPKKNGIYGSIRT